MSYFETTAIMIAFRLKKQRAILRLEESKMKKWQRILLRAVTAIVLLAGLSWFYFTHRTELILGHAKVPQSDASVTVFVPGYHGNEASFGGMISRLSTYNLGTFSYTVKIHKDGSYSEIKHDGYRTNNMIQLLFDDSRNPTAEVKEWYPYMKHLKKSGFNTVNFVGHSTGGPMSFAFMTTYAKDPDLPHFNKFVSLGGDFPVPPKQSDITAGKKLPKNLKVLTIGGRVWGSDSDGMVKLLEVAAIKPLVKPNVKSFQFKIVSGPPFIAFHYMLHENPAIDKTIANFLWRQRQWTFPFLHGPK